MLSRSRRSAGRAFRYDFNINVFRHARDHAVGAAQCRAHRMIRSTCTIGGNSAYSAGVGKGGIAPPIRTPDSKFSRLLPLLERKVQNRIENRPESNRRSPLVSKLAEESDSSGRLQEFAGIPAKNSIEQFGIRESSHMRGQLLASVRFFSRRSCIIHAANLQRASCLRQIASDKYLISVARPTGIEPVFPP